MNKEDVRIGKKQDRLIDSKRLLENLEYLRKAHLTEADVSSQDVKAYYRGFHAALKLVTGMAEHIAGTSVVRCKDCCFFDKDVNYSALKYRASCFSHHRTNCKTDCVLHDVHRR